MTYVEVNGQRYQSEIGGLMKNPAWDNRESKTITTNELTITEALAIFVDDIEWSIVEEIPTYDSEGTQTGTEDVVYDNSDFSVAGDVTDHRNGYVSITMGKQTDLEEAYELLFGGNA